MKGGLVLQECVSNCVYVSFIVLSHSLNVI